MAYTWPPGLPQTPQKGYTEEIGALIIKTPMDAGPAKIRRRGTKPAVLNMSFIMTTAQVGILDFFITNTILGTARFAFPHPRLTVNFQDPQLAEVRLMPQGEGNLYNISYLAPDFYTISLQFEVMP